ncbi:MAG: S41 family peptidase [Salinimicrobium sp.]
MNKPLLMSLLFVAGLAVTSCQKEEADLSNLSPNEEKQAVVENDLEVENFIYNGMNDIYLYKAEVPVLADDYFSSNEDKLDYLAEAGTPEHLFEKLKYSQDRFSFLTDDYVALEESFKGVSSGTAGMNFGLGRISGTNNIFGFLQYVVPNTPAADAGLTRGTVFTEVNGQQLTESNFSNLLDSGSFSINVGRIENGTIYMSDETVTLSHSEYTENPVLIAKTLNADGKKIGYIMYNSFIADFDDELNDAFGQLKSQGVTDLVLDLRYNGGGSVESAVDLASMITGQYEGEVFMKEQWNEDYQEYFESKNAESLINRFNPQIRTNELINSLNLSRVIILTSSRTASASELVINGLEPYIDVVQIGESTTGKFQASVTLYDSPDYNREDANPNHTYAVQPLVFKSANAAGKSDYINGLAPDVEYSEDLNNLGTLGDPSEPMLQLAIAYITGNTIEIQSNKARNMDNFRIIGESGMNDPNYQRMYIDKLPSELRRD